MLCGQPGSFFGATLAPSQWRHLVPPRRIELVEIISPHQGADAISLGTNTLGDCRSYERRRERKPLGAPGVCRVQVSF